MNDITVISEGLKELTTEFICLKDHFQNDRFSLKDLKGKDGVYAFWWANDQNFEVLRTLNLSVEIKGKQNKKGLESEFPFLIHNTEWKVESVVHGKVCLYVGKTHNLAKRIDQHLHQSVKGNWYDYKRNEIGNRLLKRTTACQFRSGIEHLYKCKEFDLVTIVNEHICISYYTHEANSALSAQMQEAEKMKERFYLEDLAVGYLRPFFNLDSER